MAGPATRAESDYPKNTKYLGAFFVVCLAIAATGLFWRGGYLGENLLLRFAQQDYHIHGGEWAIDIFKVRQVIRFQLALWSMAGAIVACWWIVPSGVRDYCRRHAFQFFMTAACIAALTLLLMRASYEGAWYSLQTLMTAPGSVPIFGHRLLFVWIADAAKYAVPTLSYRQSYFASQVLAIALTVWMVGRWSSLFIGRKLQWIGQVLLVAMLPVTFEYFTFYDISIVFFVALCLYLLKKEKFVAFVAALAVATFNHENIMLLIPVATLQTFSNRRLCIWLTCAALVAHFAARALVQAIVPLESHFSVRFWTNLYYPFVHPQYLVASAAALVFWWGALAVTWKSAEPFLKKAALLLPLLMAITLLVGQLHEARQFDAMIPVTIGFFLSYIGRMGKIQFGEG